MNKWIWNKGEKLGRLYRPAKKDSPYCVTWPGSNQSHNIGLSAFSFTLDLGYNEKPPLVSSILHSRKIHCIYWRRVRPAPPSPILPLPVMTSFFLPSDEEFESAYCQHGIETHSGFKQIFTKPKVWFQSMPAFYQPILPTLPMMWMPTWVPTWFPIMMWYTTTDTTTTLSPSEYPCYSWVSLSYPHAS